MENKKIIAKTQIALKFSEIFHIETSLLDEEEKIETFKNIYWFEIVESGWVPDCWL